jgi:hypothetical protein
LELQLSALEITVPMRSAAAAAATKDLEDIEFM